MVLDLLIDLKWLQEKTEKLIILNRRRRWLHSSRVKLPLVNKSATWVFGINIFDLDLWVQLDSIKQLI